MRLTHTRLLVNNYQECYQFYKDILSFPCTWGDENSNYAQFDTGYTYLSIFDKKQMLEGIGQKESDKNFPTLHEVAIIFGVDDVDATYQSLNQKINFITKPHNREDWGIRVAHFKDPSGTLIEINQRISKGKWYVNLTKHCCHPIYLSFTYSKYKVLEAV
ncbi:VOC family protein [Ornithinibacillus halotolerans]|uniref:VOC domain-containing protein n=1 Tax=Ornithinibacillus halotolerans TaxID=1274357 RepID=A0A916RVS8_9BACI|nr:VOC family protein [Ornithinibacillus halotolerans]GGA70002.1 hypothetical protein GCM10008025_12440 [Ornithinibacillus halotolerans]